MVRKLAIVVALALISSCCSASDVGTWAKVFGKAGNDVFTNAVGLDDGGFVLVGYTTSRGDSRTPGSSHRLLGHHALGADSTTWEARTARWLLPRLGDGSFYVAEKWKPTEEIRHT